MPTVKPKFELETAVIRSAAKRYKSQVDRGVSEVIPGEILWDKLEEIRYNPSRLVNTYEGREKLKRLTAALFEAIEEQPDVDQQR